MHWRKRWSVPYLVMLYNEKDEKEVRLCKKGPDVYIWLEKTNKPARKGSI
jgi:hypothetical protein